MSKRRRTFWDDETFEFRGANTIPADLGADIAEPLLETEDTEFLEEAHEALSRLFNKTNKRAKQLKGIRRKDAWQ